MRRRSRFPAQLIVALALVGAACQTDAVPTADLAITHARVLTMTGEVLEDATITIADGRIDAVLTAGSPVEAADTIDAAGKTVMPGLIDAHVHLLIPIPPTLDSDQALAAHVSEVVPGRLGEYLEHGVTTVLSTGDYWPVIGEVRDRVASGELAGPRIITTGPVFTAPDGHPATTICGGQPWCRANAAREVADPGAAREHVRGLAAEGVDAVKAVLGSMLAPRLDPDVFAAMVDEAHAAGIRAYVHTEMPVDAADALAGGVDGLVHAVSPAPVPPELIERLRTSGVTVTTTLGVFAPLVEPDGTQGQAYGGPWTEEAEQLFQASQANIRAIAEAGVPLVLGTDAPMLEPWDAVWREIEVLSVAGLSAEQILTAATRNAAQHLGMRDVLGTIEPGKIADLIVVAGDPLADLEALLRVELVMKEGRVVR